MVSVAGERWFVIERNSNRCDCQTLEDTHMSEVRGRRASVRLINGQSKTKQSDRGSRSPPRYRIVKIRGDETWYTGLNGGVQGSER